MPALVGHHPRKGQGLGADIIGNFHSCTQHSLELANGANNFVGSNEHHLSVFGKFT